MLLPTNVRDVFDVRIGRSLASLLFAVTFMLYNIQAVAQSPKDQRGSRPKIETTEDEMEVRPNDRRPEGNPASKPLGKIARKAPSNPVTRNENSKTALAATRPKDSSDISFPMPRQPNTVQAGLWDSTPAELDMIPVAWPLILPVLRDLSSPNDDGEEEDEMVSKYLNQKQAIEVTAEDWRKVLSRSERALRRQPDDKGLKARMLFAQGQIAYLRGDFTLALVAFKEITLTAPDSLLGHLGAGTVYLATRLAVEAIKSYQQVIRIDPKLAFAYKSLGEAYFQANQNKKASEVYRQARELGYIGAELIIAMEKNQAQILLNERRWEQALAKLQTVAESSPSADVYLMFGQCYEGLNQTISAAQAYTRAAEMDPQSAIAHFRLGKLLLHKREYQTAADEIERSIALDPWGAMIDLRQARKKRQEAANKIGM